jgi:hypothetical protein
LLLHALKILRKRAARTTSTAHLDDSKLIKLFEIYFEALSRLSGRTGLSTSSSSSAGKFVLDNYVLKRESTAITLTTAQHGLSSV